MTKAFPQLSLKPSYNCPLDNFWIAVPGSNVTIQNLQTEYLIKKKEAELKYQQNVGDLPDFQDAARSCG